MKIIKLIFLTLLLSSCAVHKITPIGDWESSISKEIVIEKKTEWSEGAHCFEPLFFVLSLGLIPTHCVDTYSVSSGEVNHGDVKVTSMSGWLPLVLVPLPKWRYGYGDTPEEDIKNMLLNE